MITSAPIVYADQHHDAFVASLSELLRIPSISTLPGHRGDVQVAAEWLRDHLARLGFTTELVPSDGHPLVHAEWMNAPGAPTILLYGHYDVQPVDPLALWETPPFEPSIRNGNIYARGAADDKGQIMTFIAAAESFLAIGPLPVNLKVLIEGEEEAGGRVINRYVAEHGDRLQADVAQVADTGLFAAGIPTLEAGLRGNVYTEVHLRGATQDLHSGLYGGIAPNPLNALSHIIAGLKDPDGRITIPGFYDGVRMPDQAVLESWRALPGDDEALRHEIGSPALVGEPGYSALERIWARPTLDVHGIAGGFTGEGSKTVIPAEATAKISMRIVPDQRAAAIFELFRKRVLDLAPRGVEVDVRLVGASNPVVIPTDSPYVERAREALQETFGRPAVLARSGGSIPIVGAFQEKLELNTILMGWGLPDDNLHAPNEKFSLDNFRLGTQATIRFWQGIGEMRA
jgi:acetylornithine deacetylase/succinyl-diaminopimelate desuccinylase-like protein